MKVYIYTRFSPRRNAALAESNQAQTDKCCEWLRIQFPEQRITACLYADEALSGKARDDVELLEDLIQDRPGLKGMLETLKSGDGDLVVVYDLDRLARDPFLGMAIIRAIRCRGAKLATANAGFIDLSDDGAELMCFIMWWGAKQERKKIGKRTSEAMKRHQDAGRRMSSIKSLPYGWQIDPDDSKRMIPHLEERLALDYISELIECGIGNREIAREMNKLPQFKPRHGAWIHQFIAKFRKRERED